MLDERINDGLGVFAGHFDEHHVTRLALNQGRDLAVMATDDQIAFPVSRYSAIFD